MIIVKIFLPLQPATSATYKVEFLNEKGDLIKDPVVRSGIANEVATVSDADKMLNGYEFDVYNPNNVLSHKIAEDGSTTLKLYFKEVSSTPEPSVPTPSKTPVSNPTHSGTKIIINEDVHNKKIVSDKNNTGRAIEKSINEKKDKVSNNFAEDSQQLPQTSSKENNVGILGAVIASIGSLLGLVGIKKDRKE